MNSILAAILSNLSFAFADNANGVVAKKNSPLKISVWVTIFGVVIFFLPAIIFFQNEIHKITPSNLVIMLLINTLVNIGYLSFITGMNKGSVTVTGVIGGSFPAITTLTALLFFGETISSQQLLAIILIMFGVALSSMHDKFKTVLKGMKSSGTLFALGAFFFWGVYFALIRIPIEKVGWFLPQYTTNFVGLFMFLIIAKLAKEKDVLKKPNLIWLIGILSVLQIFGSIFFNYAISKGKTSVVAPIAGSSPAVFVLIAYFIFKEKLDKKQWLGIFLSLVGIISLSLLST